MTEQPIQYQLDKAKFDILQLGAVLKSFQHYKDTLTTIESFCSIDKKTSNDKDFLEAQKHAQSMLTNMIKHNELVFGNDMINILIAQYGGDNLMKEVERTINEK